MNVSKIDVAQHSNNMFNVIERTNEIVTMYIVEASCEEEALRLFNLKSHLVAFIGTLSHKE